MRKLLLYLIITVLATNLLAQQEVQFKAEDGVSITGDYYAHQTGSAPLILLFHQAGFSRGEYRPIAAKLNALGYSCLAIDQRSGNKVNGIINETKKSAIKLGKPTQFRDAFPDLEATLNYAQTKLQQKEVIVWGSSYSSSLIFILASKYPNQIKGLLAFSPGEYFKYEGKKIAGFAKKVKCPVFISSAKNEASSWKVIFDSVNGEKDFFLPEKKGFHGSKALWEEKEGHKEYWTSVNKFLKKITK